LMSATPSKLATKASLNKVNLKKLHPVPIDWEPQLGQLPNSKQQQAISI
jgi:hypothetical protein